MGGGTRSALWTQLLADISGRTVQIRDEAEMSARGAAIIARAGLLGGGGDRIRSAAGAAALPGRAVRPDPSVTARYDEFFAVYRQLYPQLRGVFAALAGAAGQPPRSETRQ
jgi:xylulokinase